jgi:uncharacterized protein DUF4128
MSFANEAKAIEQRLATNWGTTTPIKNDNVNYSPVTGTAYIELQIHNAQGVRVTVGSTNPLYRYPGIISMNIFGPLNAGTRILKGYADSLADIFRGATFSGIICRTPKITRLGGVEGWFVYNVSIPFQRDAVETQ